MQDFKELKNRITEIKEHFSKELSSVRTGRANPALLDSIQVDAYGTKMSLRELANISMEDSRTIKIEPYDRSITKDVEKSIMLSNIGLSTSPYEGGLRAVFPELTSERREEFVKIVKKKLEEAKISLRAARDKEWSSIQERERSGEISEDVKFKFKNDMQALIDTASRDFDDVASKKENEIRQ